MRDIARRIQRDVSLSSYVDQSCSMHARRADLLSKGSHKIVHMKILRMYARKGLLHIIHSPSTTRVFRAWLKQGAAFQTARTLPFQRCSYTTHYIAWLSFFLIRGLILRIARGG